MLAGLLRWLRARGAGPPRSKNGLSEAQAIALARSVADEAYREQLTLAALCRSEQPAGWVWIVSEPAKGSVYSVEIDDATGEVLRAGLTGIR